MKTNLAGAAITGMGAICAIGCDISSIRESLQSGRSGIDEITTFSTEGLRIRHAAQVRDYDPLNHFSAAQLRVLDRTAQLAVVAARQAVADAGLSQEELASGRIGLVMGICAGGIGDGEMPVLHENWSSKEQVASGFYRMQTQAVADDLGIRGACYTISTACASSTSALATALTLLESGQVDAVVVGGADAYSVSIYAGFYSLGAMSEQATSPFSTETGATFGEGAGCIVIESEQRVSQRRAHVHGLLLACGSTSDAHHITSPHPAGEGLQRAMRLAIADANLTPSSIHYINAHGTGTLDNDISETLAIRALYEGDALPPPVSSSKSYFGHTLGGAGILEFITGIIALQNDFLPATINFKAPRIGCDLDYIPNTPRPARFDTFLSISAAFGGINAVAVGARSGAKRQALNTSPEIVVTGIGTVAPIGVGVEAFREGLLEGKSGIVPIERFDVAGLTCRHAGLVPEFVPRKLVPTIDVRRMDMFTRFAVVATALAIKDAGLLDRLKPERIGLHVAMTRGPVTTQHAFQESLVRDGIAGLSAKHFPSMVLSSVAGQIGQACRIKGASFTFVEGAGVGLQVLAHARHYLALHPELDALVVVGIDEVGALSQRTLDYLGLLASSNHSSQVYAAQGAGLVPGEGAAAIVLERETHAAARRATPYARIDGTALVNEARVDGALDQHGYALEAVARQAIGHAAAFPDVVYGMARGAAQHDRREARALGRLLEGRAASLVCLTGQLGQADAAGGLLAVSAALLGLRHGEAYPSRCAADAPEHLPLLHTATRTGQYRRALVLGSSECGNNAALTFSSMAGAV